MLLFEYKTTIDSHLDGVLTKEGQHLWWTMPVKQLRGLTPEQALAQGHAPELLRMVESYSDPSFS